MIHLNFRNSELEFSYGFEFSYWSFAERGEEGMEGFLRTPMDLEKPAYGIDLGVDFGKGKVRYYAEPQVQRNLVGLSMGGVMEKRQDRDDFQLGFQTSVWSFYLPFINMRYRRVNQENFVSPGFYFKPGRAVFDE